MKEKMKKIIQTAGELTRTFMTFFKSSEMSLSSIAVAYYLLLAIFPLVLIVGNILPFLQIDTSGLLVFLSNNLPNDIYKGVEPVVNNLLSQRNTGLLSVSVLAGFWTFSRALSALQMSMNKAYEVFNHRDFIISRIIGLASGFAILLFLYFSIVLSTFGQLILEQVYRVFPFDRSLYRTLHNMTLPAVAVAVFLSLMLLYFILPNVKIRKLRYTMPGTIFSTFVLVFLTNFIAKYVSFALNQLDDLKLIGSLVVFALMIWFIFIARVLIIGAILNAVYQKTQLGKIETRRGEIVEFIKEIRNND
ncbi:YihY/virulence factor BrkB family protein [Lactococcus taiwanensis]|uniref:YihY/virulence factor BrkB family protein n=2 Tax=Lactococcus taiwanensis TaxID=1151742 RepID=A0AA45KHA9_9LACT|nr:YihY/virulence factor BrkB family protein [uncultured Lactococcus sp.]KZK39213.1 Inner membrane protein YihY formerly thought to be RNase BN [Lactococcus cremoris]QRZ10299.1 YihY/virulence factor BrkB family protein [Lactococcus taiwanensis]QSE77335.1 YihY/virulence factor BrkB family protein [Lactococcus taiwanensis]